MALRTIYKQLILMTILVLSSSYSQAASRYPCPELVPQKASEITDTENFIAYLNTLLDLQILNSEILKLWSESVGKIPLTNPLALVANPTDSSVRIHRGQLDSVIKDSRLEHAQIIEWLQQTLVNVKKETQTRDETEHATVSTSRRMKFNLVTAGSFKTVGIIEHPGHPDWGKFKANKVNLTHNFEMTDTPITQDQYLKLMGNNPSELFGLGEIRKILIKDKTVTYLPDHPVQKLTWYQALLYANELCKKEGLKPVYKIEKTSRTGFPYEVSLQEPDKSIYETEGYRLPTIAEVYLVLTNKGKSEGKYFWGNDESQLEKYAWFATTSGRYTHPVAELEPLVVDGEDFFDLYGNIEIMTWDNYGDPKEQLVGVNPVGEVVKYGYATYGGSYRYTPYDMQIGKIHYTNISTFSSDTGFRLVRTRK